MSSGDFDIKRSSEAFAQWYQDNLAGKKGLLQITTDAETKQRSITYLAFKEGKYFAGEI